MDDTELDIPEISEHERDALCVAIASAASAVLGGLPMSATFFAEAAAFVIQPTHFSRPEVLH